VKGEITTVANLLLERGARPNITNAIRRTPMHIASIQGNKDIIDILLRYDAKTQLKDNNKHTALYYAIKEKHVEAIALLQRKEAKLSDDEKEDIINLDESTILSILKENNLSGKENKNEALFWASQNNQPEIAKWLIIKGGANVNAKDSYGNTPLHWAAYYCHITIAKMLLKAGANVTEKQKDGWPPLHVAAQKGHTVVVELLVKTGANVNEKTSDGKTPLKVAIDYGKNDVAELLSTRSRPFQINSRKYQQKL
jgi:ankyrin